eukprot:482994-Amphidinium_carterae.1
MGNRFSLITVSVWSSIHVRVCGRIVTTFFQTSSCSMACRDKSGLLAERLAFQADKQIAQVSWLLLLSQTLSEDGAALWDQGRTLGA